MKIKIKEKSRVNELNKILQEIGKKQCLIGIPEGKASRDTGVKINNATIGYINEFGSDRMHIPARPHLIPGVKKSHSKIASIMEAFLKKKLSFKGGDIRKALEACGLVASSSVKTLMQEGLHPALAQSTIKARQRQTQGDHSGDIPLINTGNYLAHITYVVTRKK